MSTSKCIDVCYFILYNNHCALESRVHYEVLLQCNVYKQRHIDTVKPRYVGHPWDWPEVSHLVKLAIITGYWEHSSQVQFKILFPNHTHIKYIKI